MLVNTCSGVAALRPPRCWICTELANIFPALVEMPLILPMPGRVGETQRRIQRKPDFGLVGPGPQFVAEFDRGWQISAKIAQGSATSGILADVVPRSAHLGKGWAIPPD